METPYFLAIQQREQKSWWQNTYFCNSQLLTIAPGNLCLPCWAFQEELSRFMPTIMRENRVLTWRGRVL